MDLTDQEIKALLDDIEANPQGVPFDYWRAVRGYINRSLRAANRGLEQGLNSRVIDRLGSWNEYIPTNRIIELTQSLTDIDTAREIALEAIAEEFNNQKTRKRKRRRSKYDRSSGRYYWQDEYGPDGKWGGGDGGAWV